MSNFNTNPNPYAEDPYRPGRASDTAGSDTPFADTDATPSELNWATWMHLAIFLHILVASAFVAPLVVLVLWLVKRDESPFLDDHGKEALNFQVSILLYAVAFVALGFLTCGIGWAAIPVIYILAIIGSVRAVLAARRSEYYRYPACLRLVP